MPEPLDLERLNLELNFQPDNQNNQPSPEFSDFATGILNEIPEEDRQIVAKYIKTWDGNVTKKFQDYSEKLKTYEQLGDLEEVQAQLAWAELINEDPLEFYNKFTEAMKEAGIMPEPFELDPNASKPKEPAASGIPDEFLQEFKAMKDELNSLKSGFEAKTQAEQEAEQQQQLDKLIADMHNTLGDFNDDYVIMQLAKADCTPQEAVARWNAEVKKYSNLKPPPPKIFSGGSGNIPQDQAVRPKTKEDRLAVIMQALEAARD